MMGANWGRPPFILLLATISLAACDAAADPAAPAPAAAASPAADLDQAAIAEATEALRAEAKVRAVSYAAPRWSVAVEDDGTRRDGYAQYVCLVLAEKRAAADATEVAIVDAGGRGRRLGGAHCRSSAPLAS